MRVTLILMLLYVEAAYALPPGQWTEDQAKTICAIDLRRLYGDTLAVVSLMGKQPHENNTVLVGLVASDGRTEYKGQQVVVGCIYKQDGSLVTIFFNSQILNWKTPKRQQAQSATIKKAPQKPAKSEPKTLEVNLGYLSYVIGGAAWLERLPEPYSNESPDAAFLVIVLSVTNNDNTSSNIPPFQLIDSRGAEYDTSSKSWRLKRSIRALESLNPGVTKKGVILFDIPKRTDYKLKLSGGYLSGESKVVDIHLR